MRKRTPLAPARRGTAEATRARLIDAGRRAFARSAVVGDDDRCVGGLGRGGGREDVRVRCIGRDLGEERPEIVRERIRVDPVKPLDRELEAFVECASTGRPPLVDGRVGLEALDVALKVQSSIRG